MLKIKNKELIIIGIILGIALYFIGMMISNVFPSDQESLLTYKVQGFIKLLGLGFITASMVVGGIIIENIDKNLRMLLLIFGLVLLIIYTIGSPSLSWDIPSYGSSGMQSPSEAAYEERPTSLGTPGFEMVYAMIAIALVLFITKINRRKR
jgi:hypothetical protein